MNYVRHLFVLALGVCLTAASSAYADSFNWTGFYLGGNVGGNWLDFDSHGFADTLNTVPIPQPGSILVASTPDYTETGAGFLGGGQLGYNQQFNWFVIGFEGDFDGTSSSATKSLVVPSAPGGLGFSVQRKFESNWMASARLRAGVAYQRLLFYATGGGAFTDVNVHASDSYPPLGLSFPSSSSKTLAGWTAGFGAEWAVRDSISIGLEYRHSGFERETYGTGSFGPVLTTQSTNTAPSNNQITLRVNILFNGFAGR